MLSTTCDIVPDIKVGMCKAAKRHLVYIDNPRETIIMLHKLQPKYFQIELDKSSVMKFPLFEIETCFPMIFVLCTDIEILPIKKKYKVGSLEIPPTNGLLFVFVFDKKTFICYDSLKHK